MRDYFYKTIFALAKKSILSPTLRQWRDAYESRRTRSHLAIRNIHVLNSYIIISNLHNTKMSDKKLAVFDFDKTIVSENTDTAVMELLQNGVPQEIKDNLKRTQNWNTFMAEIFNFLYTQNVDKCRIREVIISIPETKGMIDLLNALHKELNFDIIIISDSNLVFIKDWLEAHKLATNIKEIFTNPAEYNELGKLVIEPYQNQTECKICPKNLCKGSVLKKYIELKAKQGIQYSKVIYAGDGANDFCPMLKLNDNDIAFPRIGYACMKEIEINKDNPELSIKAFVQPWKDGYDILNVLK